MPLEDKRLLEIAQKLISYVVTKVVSKPWPGGVIPKGYEIDDILSEALTKALKTLIEKNIVLSISEEALKKLLQRRISTIVWNLAHSKENKTSLHLSPEKIEVSCSQIVYPMQPDQIKYKEERHKLLQSLNDDPEAQQVARLMLDEEVSEPSDLAKKLGKTIEEINNVLKRLRRRLWRRKHPRHYVKPSQPVLLVNANGISAQASLRDYSEDGLSLILQNFLHVSKGEQVLLTPMIPSPAAKNIDDKGKIIEIFDDRGKIIDGSFLRQYQGSFVVRWIEEVALQSTTIGLQVTHRDYLSEQRARYVD